MSLRTSIPAQPTAGEWFPLRQGIEVQSDAGLHEIGTLINGCLIILAQVETSGEFSVDGEDCDYTLNEDEAVANLHLFAAAKKLLAMVKRLEPLVVVEMADEEDALLAEINALIKEAEGRS